MNDHLTVMWFFIFATVAVLSLVGGRLLLLLLDHDR
jgi:hypothetical protein